MSSFNVKVWFDLLCANAQAPTGVYVLFWFVYVYKQHPESIRAMRTRLLVFRYMHVCAHTSSLRLSIAMAVPGSPVKENTLYAL